MLFIVERHVPISMFGITAPNNLSTSRRQPIGLSRRRPAPSSAGRWTAVARSAARDRYRRYSRQTGRHGQGIRHIHSQRIIYSLTPPESGRGEVGDTRISAVSKARSKSRRISSRTCWPYDNRLRSIRRQGKSTQHYPPHHLPAETPAPRFGIHRSQSFFAAGVAP